MVKKAILIDHRSIGVSGSDGVPADPPLKSKDTRWENICRWVSLLVLALSMVANNTWVGGQVP